MKRKIQQTKGIPLNQQLLVARDMELEDDQSVSDYNIDNNSVIHLVLMNFGASGTNAIPVSMRELSLKISRAKN